MAARADAEQQRAAGAERQTGEEQINDVLAEARRLATELAPLYDWDDLCKIIQNWCVPHNSNELVKGMHELSVSCVCSHSVRSRLAELDRHPTLEQLYAGTFNPLLKQCYGTTEAYLRLQLGWPAQEARSEEQDEDEYWTRGATTNVRRNDWPYAIPKDVQ